MRVRQCRSPVSFLKRKGSGVELEVVKVLQAMLLAKPATDPDSGIFTARWRSPAQC